MAEIRPVNDGNRCCALEKHDDTMENKKKKIRRLTQAKIDSILALDIENWPLPHALTGERRERMLNNPMLGLKYVEGSDAMHAHTVELLLASRRSMIEYREWVRQEFLTKGYVDVEEEEEGDALEEQQPHPIDQ